MRWSSIKGDRLLVESSPPNGSPRLIAVVDDDEDVSSALGSLIESMGIHAMTFGSADIFLADRDRRFDLVISDVQMPGTSGLELAKILGKEAVPLILITAFPSPEVKQQAIAQGVRCFMRKPFDPDELIDCIERILAGDL
ncbi:response regulator [Novosphingobium sp. MD-1]|uniref:response regulator n=1 Tax=Novosphingobium sp. MD-1 TaxID=1630648 RepID=UPI000F7DC4EC